MTLRNFVGGEYVDAEDGRTSDVIDPSTGETYAQAPVSGPADVDAAMSAAAAAFEDWRDATPSERINTHIPFVSEMPHGGFKHSGYGKDLSMYGFEDYTRIKHVMSCRSGRMTELREPGAATGTKIAAIELRGVVKTYQSRGETVAAVRGVDLSIAEGEFFSLLGPSGCGKTTTMRMIAGFDEPTEGQIILHGRDVVGVPPNRRDVNMVFQSYALFPHMSVLENVAFGLRRKNTPKDEVTRRVGEMLEIVDLAGREKRRPRELSGGQQQRVALARALVNRPRALLLDEPLGALDLKLRQAMQVELKRIQREVGITFVYVTHDQGEALTMSDRIAVMNDGVIEQLGPPREVYERPATTFVAGFIGTSNVLSGTVSRTDGDTAVIEAGPGERIRVPWPGGRSGPGGRVGSVDQGRPAPAVGSAVELTVRPEKIAIGLHPPDGDACALRGTVTEVVYLGTFTNYTVRTSIGAEVVVFVQNVSSADDIAASGDTVWLSWEPRHSYAIGEV